MPNFIRKLTGAAATIIALGFAGAQAAEAIKPAGPIGGTDLRQAVLPPPGLYGIGVGLGLNLPKYWTEDDTLGASGGVAIGGAGLLYVYDTEFLGGSLSSSVFASYERSCFGITPMRETCSSGFGDIYSDVLMWNRYFPSEHAAGQTAGGMPIPYGLHVLAGLGVTFPTGNYDASRMVNNGSNTFDIAPNAAFTYIAPSIFGDRPGHSTEFSARVFLNNYTRNGDTDYQTGRIGSLDFSISQRVNQWQFGIAGTSFLQFEDDEIAGARHPNNGNRSSSISLGPVVSYDFMANDRPWSLTFKALVGVTGKNTAPASGLAVRLATKFF